MLGYQVPCVQDGGRSTWKENTLNKCLKKNFFFYFTCYTGTNTQGSKEFIPNFPMSWFRRFDNGYGSDIKWLDTRNPKTVHCSLQSGHSCRSPLSQPANFAGSWRLATTLYSIKFYRGRLCPKVQPLILLYTITILTEKVPLSYTFNWKKEPKPE